MSRRAARFTQVDVARALRAAEQVAPGRCIVEIGSDGAIRIRTLDAAVAAAAASVAAPETEQPNPFERGLSIVP